MDVILKNRRDKKICINFNDGTSAALLAKGTAKISDDNLTSQHLQAFIERGDVAVIRNIKSGDIKPGKKKEIRTSSAYPKKAEKEGRK